MADKSLMTGAVNSLEDVRALYDFGGRTAVVTGGTGVLGAAMARALAACHASVVLVGRNVARAEAVISTFAGKGRHLAIAADVLDRPALEEACRRVVGEHGQVDILVNGAGGNDPRATTTPDARFFDVPLEAWQAVTHLNLLGTILPSQVFARPMAERKEGVVLNVSSVNASRPLTRIAAYSASKAGISNFTQWLAVHLAQEYAPAIRVNAVMPGFFLTEQNRFLLTDRATGALTARGQKILDHTPMARFGVPDDLTGAVLWLLSPAARFVTGIVVPVDGGFTAYSGV
ncbi:MAG TPA: SDR family oxidoreductase [Polyangia bacterium]|nr:SDR family oxidoreductase [Polyangia bacterium]